MIWAGCPRTVGGDSRRRERFRTRAKEVQEVPCLTAKAGPALVGHRWVRLEQALYSAGMRQLGASCVQCRREKDWLCMSCSLLCDELCAVQA
jgi:hypothetical protein